jgi:phosphoglycerate dehydrogenase-like enzyme
MIKVAVLDDWQNIARESADWSVLDGRAEVAFFPRPFGSAQETVSAVSGFDAILAMRERTAFPPGVVEQLPRLRFFNMTGRRARGLDEMVRRGIVVSITGGGEAGEDTAEHALALMLAAERHVPEGDCAIKGGRFQEGVRPGFRLAGKTFGVLGFGLIGKRMARYTQALGMNVIAWARSLTPEEAAKAGVEAVGRDELFERSDIVSIHLVLAPGTTGIVGPAQFALMRRGAVLVNTSRAALIDETALLEALSKGRIQAALDVFPEEPLPSDHPLRSAPNAVLTPHLGYGTLDTYRIFYRNSIENTLAFLDGAPIRRYDPGRHGHG